MAQTTKRVRQRIEQKRNRQRQRQSRRRLSLISLFATSIVVVLPAILYSFFAWSTINETFQVVPTYEEAVQNFLSTAPNQIAPQFLARDQAGEPVLLIQSSESSNNIRWVQANELNSQTLNGVYALSPDIFIKPTGPNSPNLNSIIANQFFSNQTGETLSPLTPIAQSLLAQAGQRGTGLEVQLVIAELQASWTAEELATWLLNSSYYGNQQFGLAAAASFYYDRVGTQLTLPESAMLLGILDNPNINPVDNPAGAKLRQEAVLEEMLRQNFITQEQFIAARFTPLDVSQNTFVDQPNLILNRLLNSRLENLFSADEIANRQLNVVTTIDPALQQVTDCLSEYYHNYLSGLGLTGSADCPEAVEFATQDYFPSSNIRPVDSLLLVIINPLTGEILALSGAGEIADLPLDSPQNPGGQLELGSVFYPFIYTSALSQGHALSSMVIDIASPEGETPTGSGPIFLGEAILSGSPDAAADVMEWVGQSNIFTLANELGVRSLERSSSIYSPLNSTADVQAGFLDVAQAYAVLANGGVQPNEQANLPIVIQQVEDERGDILFEQQSGTDRPILPSEIAWLVNQSITSTPLGDGQPFAIVQPSTAVQNGEWTIGYTPNRLVAVWAGSTQPSGTAQQTGQPVTLPLWQHVTEISTRS
ncbi:MAG: transglycosylase domain-containing protein, partial [Chloroflexota bacterium]